MKKYLMNKNVTHNGILYAKGSELKESDKGAKEIIDAGHVDVFEFSEPKEEKPAKQGKFGKESKE